MALGFKSLSKMVRGAFLGCVLLMLAAFTPLPQEPAWQTSQVRPLLQPGVRWMQAQLALGASPDDKHVWSEASARAMWTPQVTIPIRAYPAPITDITPQFSGYGYGWNVQDYRGVKVVQHGGAVFDVLAFVVLVPERNLGIALQINAEDVEAGIHRATSLTEIEISGERAVAHKKFNGEIRKADGGVDRLNWQTLYFCRKVDGQWKLYCVTHNIEKLAGCDLKK